jgi:predicted RNase H-like HicB family nuclease
MKKQPSDHQEEISTTTGTKYVCYLSREQDGGYVVSSPGVPPPLSAFGETLDEARANAREDIEAWETEAERLRAHCHALCDTESL